MTSIPVSLVADAEDPFSLQAFVDGAIGNERVRFLVDTGARTCLVPRSPATAELPSVGRSGSAGAANVDVGDEEVVVPAIRVGDLIARDVVADRARLGSHRHPLLGVNVLGRHRCMFRFAAGVIDVDVPVPAHVDTDVLDETLGVPFVTVGFEVVALRACWAADWWFDFPGRKWAVLRR